MTLLISAGLRRRETDRELAHCSRHLIGKVSPYFSLKQLENQQPVRRRTPDGAWGGSEERLGEGGGPCGGTLSLHKQKEPSKQLGEDVGEVERRDKLYNGVIKFRVSREEMVSNPFGCDSRSRGMGSTAGASGMAGAGFSVPA